ncbi:hypothetical protein PVAND_001906 [Polypedilum vanderplanki]|uniref:Uncharacterized protein n=1 Tax=Polypedilum vanderplanki TaxID=319348 RepID=A0A9J6BQR4_POLVA|nr:hypothetical protein PVAND_001906 [Polypedilum vanderplanki]
MHFTKTSSLKSQTELYGNFPLFLCEALMSMNSQDINQSQQQQQQRDLSVKNTTHVDTIWPLNSITNANDDGIERVEISSDEETELWQTARMCPNGCDCGKCPIESTMSSTTSNMSLVHPNVSSISLKEQSYNNSFISITHIVPLRNLSSAIIHWDVMHYHGIRGYKVYLDGNLVTSVHSPTRTSALIESVNMSYPHHFAVTIVLNVDEQLPKMFIHRNMQAIHIYRPRNFIH